MEIKCVRDVREEGLEGGKNLLEECTRETNISLGNMCTMAVMSSCMF